MKKYKKYNFFKPERRGSHPGWAIQLDDGGWLSYAHGWHVSDDAFFARTFESEETAKADLEDAREDFVEPLKANIVLAWEPLCERLRHEVITLRGSNTISPDDILNITMSLQGIISDLENAAFKDEEDEEDE